MARRSALQDLTNIVNPKALQDKQLAPANHAGALPRPPAAAVSYTGVPLAVGAAGEPVRPALSPRTDDHLRWGGEYRQDIFRKLRCEESLGLVRPNYLEPQSEINAKMRAILVDWLVEVHTKYRLRPETLYLSVSLIDRYLSKTSVQRKSLQLVGVVGMFLGAKFEEIVPPEVVDFVYITANAYTKDEILRMECVMLQALGYQLCAPTAAHFFDTLLNANCCDAAHKELVRYIAELALVEIHMVGYAPSQLVAAATLLSNELVGRQALWPASMAQEACYTELELRSCVSELRLLHQAAPTSSLQAVRQRYMLDLHHGVARATSFAN